MASEIPEGVDPQSLILLQSIPADPSSREGEMDGAALSVLRAVGDLAHVCGNDPLAVSVSLGRAAVFACEGQGDLWEADVLRDVSALVGAAVEMIEQEEQAGGVLFALETNRQAA
jgi:hypothetical protein